MDVEKQADYEGDLIKKHDLRSIVVGVLPGAVGMGIGTYLATRLLPEFPTESFTPSMVTMGYTLFSGMVIGPIFGAGIDALDSLKTNKKYKKYCEDNEKEYKPLVKLVNHFNIFSEEN